MSNGYTTTALGLAGGAIDVLVNSQEGTARMPVAQLAAQLAAEVPGPMFETYGEMKYDEAWLAGARCTVWGDPNEALRGVWKKTGWNGVTNVMERISGLPVTAMATTLLNAKVDRAELDHRPGHAPLAWRLQASGKPTSGADLLSSTACTIQSVAGIGTVAVVTDADVTLSPRSVTPVYPGRVYRIDAYIKRLRNPADPVSDVVRIGLNALDYSYTPWQLITVKDMALRASDGLWHVTATAAISTAIGEPDHLLPPNTVYLAPWVRLFGADHQTAIVQVEVTDITAAAEVSGALDAATLVAALSDATAAAQAVAADRDAVATDRAGAETALLAANAAAAEAELYDGPKIDSALDLSTVSGAMVAEGAFVRVIEDGAVYQRVSSGADLDFTQTGGVALRRVDDWAQIVRRENSDDLLPMAEIDRRAKASQAHAFAAAASLFRQCARLSRAASPEYDFVRNVYRSGDACNAAGVAATMMSARADAAYWPIGTLPVERIEANKPRIHPAGLVLERAGVNHVFDGMFSAAVVGVVGAGGALPAGWTVRNGGSTVEVLSMAVVDGVPRLRLKVSADGSQPDGGFWISMCGAGVDAGSALMTASMMARIVSIAGATAVAAQIFHSNGTGSSDAPLATGPMANIMAVHTPSATVTSRVQIKLTLPTATAYDVTIDLSMPQLEGGGTQSSFIPTVAAASMIRDADIVNLPVAPGTYDVLTKRNGAVSYADLVNVGLGEGIDLALASAEHDVIQIVAACEAGLTAPEQSALHDQFGTASLTTPDYNFFDGFGGRWMQHKADVPHAIQVDGGRSNAIRFEAREGEHPAFDDGRAVDRAEIIAADGPVSDKLEFFTGDDIWLSGALNIETPGPLSNGFVVLAQFKLDPTGISVSPFVSLGINPLGEFQLLVRGIDGGVPVTNVRPANIYGEAAWPRGIYVNLVLRVRFSFDNTGVVQMWRDGVLVADYSGPVGWDYVSSGGGPAYLKLGIYRDSYATPAVVTWSNLRVIKTSLADKIASPDPVR